MRISKELRAEANRIAQKWWKEDTTFGKITDLTPADIAQEMAILKRLASEDAVFAVEGVEGWLKDATDFIAAGNAKGAAEAGIRAGLSFFMVVTNFARPHPRGRTTKSRIWDLIFKLHKEHADWRIKKEVISRACAEYRKKHPKAKIPSESSLASHFRENIRKRTHI